MVDDRVPALVRRLNAQGRVSRQGRIFARPREGWDYDEIAREEKLTPERIRRIVRQALERRRIVDEGAEHAKLQLARLAPAMRLALEAVADGDVKAIAPLMKVLDRLDRYRRIANANQVYDDEAREKLLDKINRVAANLGVDEARAAVALLAGDSFRSHLSGLGRLGRLPPDGAFMPSLRRSPPSSRPRFGSKARAFRGRARPPRPILRWRRRAPRRAGRGCSRSRPARGPR